MGIARVCRAVRVAKDPRRPSTPRSRMAAGRTGSFAVRARRRDKRVPGHLGRPGRRDRRPGPAAYGYPVDLSHPDLTIFVEVDQREVFVYTDGCAGPGRAAGRDERPRAGADVRRDRLPGGRVPDDAPRAALRLPALLRHAADRPRVGVQGVRAGPQLDRFQCDSRMYVVRVRPGPAAAGVFGRGPAPDRGAAPADAQDRRRRWPAASAPPRWSPATRSARSAARRWPTSPRWTTPCRLPILRPLIGQDKIEIMAEARRIGTLALSELPDQDCCTLLTPRQVGDPGPDR